MNPNVVDLTDKERKTELLPWYMIKPKKKSASLKSFLAKRYSKNESLSDFQDLRRDITKSNSHQQYNSKDDAYYRNDASREYHDDEPSVASRKFTNALHDEFDGILDPEALDDGWDELSNNGSNTNVKSSSIDQNSKKKNGSTSSSLSVLEILNLSSKGKESIDIDNPSIVKNNSNNMNKNITSGYESYQRNILDPNDNLNTLVEVSVDPLFKSILSFNVPNFMIENFTNTPTATYSNSSNNNNDRHAGHSLPSIQNRYMHEDHYIEVFQPLLEEEVKAALSSRLLEGNDRDWGGRSHSYGNQKTRRLHRTIVRCAMFTDRFGDSSLQEARVARVARTRPGGDSLGLDGGGRYGVGAGVGGMRWVDEDAQGSDELCKDDLVLVLKASEEIGIAFCL